MLISGSSLPVTLNQPLFHPPSDNRYDPRQEDQTMSWVDDLASVLGVPGGALVVAGAMYGACVVAEKAAHPDALSVCPRSFYLSA